MGFSDIISSTKKSHNCFASSDLDETTLDTTQTANFKDRFILDDQLGWGRFGIIRECSDKLTGEVLACKSISKERLITEDDVKSVKLEIEILAELSGHEHIVDLKAVYEDRDYVHLIMELCAGGELFHLIEDRGRFNEDKARVIFRQLMEVVMHCHRKGIVHRDLKPENILLASKSSSSTIKLADFGLATYIQPGKTLHGTVGSPFYIAPEVLSGDYNQKADVWSCGVILYILLSGTPPFWGKTKSTIFDAVRAANLSFHLDCWANVSASAKGLISKMLCIDPSKRLTASQVLAHSWTKEAYPSSQEPFGQELLSRCGAGEDGGCYLFDLSLAREEDLSFRYGSSPLIAVNDEQGEDSPAFTCSSSFSTPFTGNQRCKTNATDLSSPVSSMPSFTFLTPLPALELSEGPELSSVDDDDSSVRRWVLSPDQEKKSEVVAGIERTSTWKLQSKRNNTIGLGEFDHIHLVSSVSSVSRWASCTQISTSLRSSLVC